MLGLLVLRRQRPGFDPQWGRCMEDLSRAALKEMDWPPLEPQAGVIDDATLRAAIAQFTAAGCDTLIVLQPSMGDIRLVPTLAQQWNGGIVFWATPERPDGEKVSSCSLVGAHAAAALLRQLGRPFELVWGHPGEELTRQRLRQGVRVARTGTMLRRAKIGLIGEHAPGFIDMQADPATLSRQLGTHLHQIALQELIDRVRGISEEQLSRDIAAAQELGLSGDAVAHESLAIDSRYYLAMRGMMEDQNLDALAVRCWPELPNIFGQWPYLAMARLTTERRIVALEGDADGALTGLILSLLDLGPGYISDWLEHEDRSITLWHPGHAPLWLCEPVGSADGPRLGTHFNTGQPLVVNAVLRAELPITICRAWRCGGRYRMTAARAYTRQPKRRLLGAHGRAELLDRDAGEWFEELCHAGMPHHITIVEGHHEELLRRCARHLRIEWGP